MIQRIEPQDGAAGLFPHANRLTLRGSPADAAFPPLCPNCGSAASGKISCSKVFSRENDEGFDEIVTTVDVPFCDPCIATHRAQEHKPALIDVLVKSFADMHVVGAIFPGLAALFLVHLGLRDLVHGRLVVALVELGLGAAAALLAWGQAWAVWRNSAPRRVLPPTEVTTAFDFSDDLAPAFEQRRFACTMRDGRFAEAFRALNVDNEHVPGSTRAVADQRRGNLKLWLFAAVVAVLVLKNCFEEGFR